MTPESGHTRKGSTADLGKRGGARYRGSRRQTSLRDDAPKGIDPGHQCPGYRRSSLRDGERSAPSDGPTFNHSHGSHPGKILIAKEPMPPIFRPSKPKYPNPWPKSPIN